MVANAKTFYFKDLSLELVEELMHKPLRLITWESSLVLLLS